MKGYLFEAATGELRWLHAELGATMPYRQAKRVMDLLLPTSGRDSHVTIRNHTMAIGKCVQNAKPLRPWCEEKKPYAELGIDVGYVRLARSNRKGQHGRGDAWVAGCAKASQHMRWIRVGAHNVVQVRVALLNNELDGLARSHFPWIGQRRVSWPWQQPSQGFYGFAALRGLREGDDHVRSRALPGKGQ